MPSEKVKRKFLRRGRQAAFARFVGVSRTTVSDWLDGKTTSARLDRAAREWQPSRTQAPAEKPGIPSILANMI